MRQFYFLFLFFTLSIGKINAQVTDVITSIGDVNAFALNGNELYIAFFREDKISKIDITAVTPMLIDVITGIDSPSALAFKGNDLYIAVTSSDKISKIDITAVTPTLIDVITGVDSPSALAFKGNDLYIAEWDRDVISKIDITAATPTAVDVIVNPVGGPNELVFKGNDLYISGVFNHTIVKVDITSATPSITTVVNNLTPSAFTISGDFLYVAEILTVDLFESNQIFRIDITSPTQNDPVLVLNNINSPNGLVFNGNDLYISESGDNKISKYNIEPTLSNDEFSSTQNQNISLYPNPVNDFIQISGLTKTTNYKIYNVLGTKIAEGIVSNNVKIDLKKIISGLYYLTFNNENTIKFIKN